MTLNARFHLKCVCRTVFLADSVDTGLASLLYSCNKTDAVLSEVDDQ